MNSAAKEREEKMSEFKKPEFKENILELRSENNKVCIYGTKEGLEKLSNLISKIIAEPNRGSIYLEDHYFLTDNSLSGVIGIFEKGTRL